jgi:hypothetical protein
MYVRSNAACTVPAANWLSHEYIEIPYDISNLTGLSTVYLGYHNEDIEPEPWVLITTK